MLRKRQDHPIPFRSIALLTSVRSCAFVARINPETDRGNCVVGPMDPAAVDEALDLHNVVIRHRQQRPLIGRSE
jgi:hypothetical protein